MKRQKQWGDPWDYADRHNASLDLRRPNRYICIACRGQAMTEAGIPHQPGCPAAVAETPLPKKKFETLLKSVRSGELKLADIEVPPPSKGGRK